MSVSEVHRLFGALREQYELDGTIDPHQKALFLEEMKKFAGGENFVQQMQETFEGLEKDDDKNVPIFPTSSLIAKVGRNLKRRDKALEIEKPRPYKLKFDAALKVFNLFQITCHVEQSPVEEYPEYFTGTSGSTVTHSTASASTKSSNE